MKHVRASVRVVFLVLYSTLITLIGAPALLLNFVNRSWAAVCTSRICRIWSKGMRFILGIRFDVEGTPPRSGTFAVSNHLSHIDVMTLSTLYPTNFIAKQEIASWPLIGIMARVGGTLWINREKARDTARIRDEIDYYLKHGACITMFAEGTSWRGDEVLPFRAPLFQAAAALKTPCVPVAISYSTPGAGPGPAGPDGGDPCNTVCWWNEVSLVAHYWKMMGLPRIVARVRFGEPVFGDYDRKSLAAECHRRVVEMFEPIPQVHPDE